jgi:hypothetical protein
VSAVLVGLVRDWASCRKPLAALSRSNT